MSLSITTIGKIISNTLYCLLFSLSAYTHFQQWDHGIESIQKTSIPDELAQYCYIIAISLLALGTISIMGDIFPAFGHMCYIMFLIPVTWFMHAHPALEAYLDVANRAKSGVVFKSHLVHVLKNIALIGASLRCIVYQFQLPKRKKSSGYTVYKKTN